MEIVKYIVFISFEKGWKVNPSSDHNFHCFIEVHFLSAIYNKKTPWHVFKVKGSQTSMTFFLP